MSHKGNINQKYNEITLDTHSFMRMTIYFEK